MPLIASGQSVKKHRSPGFKTSLIDRKNLKSLNFLTETPKDHGIEASNQILKCCDDWKLVKSLSKVASYSRQADKKRRSHGFQTSKIVGKKSKSQNFLTETPKDHCIKAPYQI